MNSRQETKAIIVKEQLLVVLVTNSGSAPFSYSPDRLLRNGTAHSGLDPPVSVNSEENPSQTFPQANLIEANPQLSPSSQMTLGFV